MSKYKFLELTDEQFFDFVENHEQKHFMQSVNMKDYYKLKGKETYIIGVESNKKIIAAGLVYLESMYKKYKKFAVYKGFIMDYNNQELLDFITHETCKFLKTKGAYVFTIDPNIIQVERDTDANVIENGKDNYKVIDYLNKLGYIKSDTNIQIKWTYVLDVNGQSSDEIFKTFKQNTRNIINRTINKYKLNIRTLSYNELCEFKKITQDTSDRRGFDDKSLVYYQNMSKAFGDKVTFKVAELNCNEYLEDLNKEKMDYQNKIDKINGTNKKKENYIQELGYINKKIDEVEKLKNEKGNIIPLSCAMFILYGDEVVYFSSGSYKEYMQYYGQYIIQWEMIKYACDNNYKRYNFYGIMDVFNPKGKDRGVYEFKKGFNGYVKELLGEYVYVIDKKIYKQETIINKIKKIIKR
jgi:lipid II:glycine glycyltransferase (peptidoglycan interpeptide bridge formation enzyme)